MPTFSSVPSSGLTDLSSHFSVGSPNTETGQGKTFEDRRSAGPADTSGSPDFQNSRGATPERRQFGSSHSGLTDNGRELALAIDRYKLEHHRRYITCDEMLSVLHSLGYERSIPSN
ncbi:MAG: hypothetical protein AAF989_15985 [Planctomycetota bacterium]